MTASSNNFRDSAIQDIMHELREYNVQVIIYEPTLNTTHFEQYLVQNDLSAFLNKSDVILANRMHADLEGSEGKLYTRDLFGEN